MKKNKQENILWLGWNSFFTDLSSEVIKPILPIFMKVVLGADVLIITLFNTVSDFLANIFKIIFGIYSDKKDNKKELLLLGYGLSNFIKPFLFLAFNVYLVFVIEFFNKIGKGVRSVPKEVLMTYSLRDNELGKGFGFQKMMDSLGAFFGVLVLSMFLYFFEVGINYIFLFTIIPGIISWYIIRNKVVNITLEDVGGKKKVNKFTKESFNTKNIFSLGEKYNKLLTFSILFAIGNIPVVFFILLALEAGIDYYIITLFYAGYSLIDAYFSYILGKETDKKGKENNIMIISLIALALANIVVILGTNIHPIFSFTIAFLLLGFYEAGFEGLFKKIIVKNVKKEQVGTGLGVYMGITGLTKVIFGILLSIVWMNYSIFSVFYFSLFFIIIASIYFILFIKDLNKNV